MSNNQEKTINDLMASLRERYLKELLERQEKIKLYIKAIEEKQPISEKHNEICQLAHKLSGTGKTYGFPLISEKGGILEDRILDNSSIDENTILSDLRNLLSACETAHKMDFSKKEEIVSEQPKDIEFITEVLPQLPLLLIVDDDPNVRNIFNEILAKDARILIGTNTTEAFDLIKLERPDLVLLDDQMGGGISGLEMLEKMQTDQELKSIPVMMITASDKPQDIMRGLMAGAIDYITKPFDPVKIMQTIKTRLQRLNTTILIADDDQSVRDLLEHKFRNTGCNIILAEEGEQALGLMQKKPPSLAILDRMMPGYDGITVLQKMREIPKLSKTPVIFLTAKHADTDVLEGLNLGAADYIIKPFNSDEVVVRCMRLLTNQK